MSGSGDMTSLKAMDSCIERLFLDYSKKVDFFSVLGSMISSKVLIGKILNRLEFLFLLTFNPLAPRKLLHLIESSLMSHNLIFLYICTTYLLILLMWLPMAAIRAIVTTLKANIIAFRMLILAN